MVDECEVSLTAKVSIKVNVKEIVQDRNHPPLLCHLCRLLGGRLAFLDAIASVSESVSGWGG